MKLLEYSNHFEKKTPKIYFSAATGVLNLSIG
jgi:hypothetical protein